MSTMALYAIALSTVLIVVQAMDKLMPGFDGEIAKLAQRVLVNPRHIDWHTGVLATKVTPGGTIMLDSRRTCHVVVSHLKRSDLHSASLYNELWLASGIKRSRQNTAVIKLMLTTHHSWKQSLCLV